MSEILMSKYTCVTMPTRFDSTQRTRSDLQNPPPACRFELATVSNNVPTRSDAHRQTYLSLHTESRGRQWGDQASLPVWVHMIQAPSCPHFFSISTTVPNSVESLRATSAPLDRSCRIDVLSFCMYDITITEYFVRGSLIHVGPPKVDHNSMSYNRFRAIVWAVSNNYKVTRLMFLL